MKPNALILVQSCIRRYIAQQAAHERFMLKVKNEEDFAQFCTTLSNREYKFKMFSKRHEALSRKIFIDESRCFLCWKIGFLRIRKVELTKLFKVEGKFSDVSYVSKPTKPGLCMSLYFIGHKIIDLEANDQATFESFIKGLNRIIFLMNGPPARYIDPCGIPRRAGPSVIQSALKVVR